MPVVSVGGEVPHPSTMTDDSDTEEAIFACSRETTLRPNPLVSDAALLVRRRWLMPKQDG
jgi:hypothetical protein